MDAYKKNIVSVFLFFSFFLFCPYFLLADSPEPIPTSIHIHSDISSGARPINEIVELAKKQNVRVVILTDLLNEHYEYGLWPFRSILKKNFDRNSISTAGAAHYMEQISQAAARHPDVLIIDGSAVTPFYYWSGNVYPGPLVLNNRAKDILVFGLGNAEDYSHLPIVSNGTSGFTPYAGDQYSKPYQLLIDHVKSKTQGLVFWSHPHANEHIAFEKAFFGLSVFLDTPSYEESLLNTFRYDGFGVFATDLSQTFAPGYTPIHSPGGIWDRVLLEYCQGKRDQPAWAIGEEDYNGYPDGVTNLDVILNMILAPQATQSAVLEAIQKGRNYVIISASHTNRFILDEFTIANGRQGDKVGMGDQVELSDAPLIKIKAHTSGSDNSTIQLLLIRNGQVIQQWEKTFPFEIEYEDLENNKKGKFFYRLIAYSEQSPHRLLTNPIFTERK